MSLAVIGGVTNAVMGMVRLRSLAECPRRAASTETSRRARA